MRTTLSNPNPATVVPRRPRWAAFSAISLLASSLAGCSAKLEDEVRIQTNAVRESAAPILDGFDRQYPKCTLHRNFGDLSSKTTTPPQVAASQATTSRAATALAAAPDTLWDVEFRSILQMQRNGKLEKIRWDLPSGWPESFRAKDGTWVGIAAEAIVLVVNVDKLPEPTSRPTSILDLAAENWRGQVSYPSDSAPVIELFFEVLESHAKRIAIPEHLQAARFNQAGTLDFKAWSEELSLGGHSLSGHSLGGADPSDERASAEQVVSGAAAWGLIRSSLALSLQEAGAPIEIVFPDQFSGGFGTVLIPQGVAVAKSAEHPAAARQLANYLVSPSVESRMVMGNAGCIPIHPQAKEKSRLKGDEQVRWATVDFEKVDLEKVDLEKLEGR